MLDVSKMTQADLIKLVMAQQAALAEANKTRKLTMKVAKSGGMSLYGMGRWPITLYKSQWQQLLGHTKEIEAFLATNDALLASKPTA